MTKTSYNSARPSSLPDFLTDLLNQCPSAGSGVHNWLYRVARQLHVHMPAGRIVELLEERTRNCGRHVPRREIVSAVQDALQTSWQPAGDADRPARQPKWPAVNLERRQGIINDEGGLADLFEASPVRFDDGQAHTAEIIAALFPGNPLLCCGASSSRFATKSLSEWADLDRLALIVPSPMSARTGLTRDGSGRQSAHTLDNTGPRRFQVCEFDSGSVDDHAALLMHLARFAPLTLAVHSGGKSLHGWFAVNDWPEERTFKFFRYATSIGADPATWTRSQFVRMPGGTRENGKRQSVYYFAPSKINQEVSCS